MARQVEKGFLGAETVGIDQIRATGSPSASTFLRGDETWADISDQVLVPAGAWDSGTTYAKRALVTVEDNGDYHLFVSRIDGNLNNTPDTSGPGDTTEWMYLGLAAQGPSGEGDRADIMVSIPGQPRADVMIYRLDMRFDGELDESLSGASAAVASTGEAVFTVKLNGVAVGTITFNASDTGAVDFPSAVVFEPGDVLSLHSPETVDPTLAWVSITLAATRGST